MWRALLLTGLLVEAVFFHGVAQGMGGGVWLEDGATCVGSLIYKNQATDGFGVAGGNGILLNSTLSQNSRLAVTVHYPQPGDIYCANGDIVDRETYKTRAAKDAIGIVFWLNGDPDVTYPKGAVVSIDGQKRCSWGVDAEEYWVMGDMIALGYTHCYRKDTACYRNTALLEKWWKEWGGQEFEAGHHCWNYKAYFQTHNPNDKTKDIRWVLPTLKYLSNLMIVLPKVIESLEVIRQTTPISVDDFVYQEDKETEAYYWTSSDGVSEGYSGLVWLVNFYNGCCYNDWPFSTKDYQNLARPIFLY